MLIMFVPQSIMFSIEIKSIFRSYMIEMNLNQLNDPNQTMANGRIIEMCMLNLDPNTIKL